MIGIRQGRNLLRVKSLMLGGNNDAVGDDVINIRSTHRSGTAEKVHLNRRGAQRENPRAVSGRETCQIDSDIDLHFAQ